MRAGQKKIAGIGYRAAASTASLEAALIAAGGANGLTALASIAGKADGAPLAALAARLGLPVLTIDEAELAAQQTLGNVFAGVVIQSTRPFKVGDLWFW